MKNTADGKRTCSLPPKPGPRFSLSLPGFLAFVTAPQGSRADVILEEMQSDT